MPSSSGGQAARTTCCGSFDPKRKRPVRFRDRAEPHRPGPAPALGLRAGEDGIVSVPQTASSLGEICTMYPTLLTLWPTLSGRAARPVPSRRRPAFRRPLLEALEDRALPSILTVLNALDSGAGSLRDTISRAKSGDTIVFAQSLDGQTITLTSNQLEIKNSLNIVGPGAGLLTISGNDTNRVFAIDEGLAVSVAALTITHGLVNGAEGGGILDAGSSLSLANDVLSYNQDLGNKGSTGGGGAISARGGASLVITATTFIGNQAVSPKNGAYIVGGAINVADTNSSATVTDCTFTANKVIGGNGGSLGSGGTFAGTVSGGAINNTGALIVMDSMFTDNQAIGGNGNSGAKGSGTATDIGASAGGGIWSGGVMIVSGCTFTNNQAVGGSNNAAAATGASKVGAGESGALENGPEGVATVTNCTFDYNEARGGDANTGGANAVQLGSGIAGAFRNAGTLTLAKCTFTGNQAVGGAGNTGGAFVGAGTGGAFVNQVAVVGAVAGEATISSCAFIGNQASGGPEGAGGNGGDGLGGAIANLLGSTLTVSNCILTGNQAVGGAGGSGANGGNGFGGGIYNDGLSILPANAGTPSTLTMTGSTITANQAIGGAAGSGGSVGQGIGGGAYFAARGVACLDAATVANILGNTASTSNNDMFGVFTTC
jgi:hypothetical protein